MRLFCKGMKRWYKEFKEITQPILITDLEDMVLDV